MENLKRILIAVCIIFGVSNAMAQNQATYQAAFSKSYESEQAKKYNTAIEDVKSVYRLGDYTCNIRLGWLNYLAKQYSESIKYYNIAISLKPYAIEARFGCIKPLSALESWDKVKDNYIYILKIDPQNTLANYWLGVIYYNRKEFTKAAKLFEKVVNLYPLDYDSIIMFAWSKLNIGQNADAKILFNHALLLHPNDKSSLEGLKLLN